MNYSRLINISLTTFIQHININFHLSLVMSEKSTFNTLQTYDKGFSIVLSGWAGSFQSLDVRRMATTGSDTTISGKQT